VATPYSIMLAKETVRLVARYLPQALAHPDDLMARYYLLYASAIAGIAFDNGMLHFTHALEHPLSAVKPELPHGLGLPAVVKHIYPAQPEVLADILSPVVGTFAGVPGEAAVVAERVEEWLFDLGVTSKLRDEGYAPTDLDRLTDLALETPSLGLLLSLAPIPADRTVVHEIYAESLAPMA
jgi:alcohol dehydrogenase class IV